MSEPETHESAPQRQFDNHTVWQVKASTLCNLRCRYCYEWDRLGDTRRMSLDQWRRILEAAVEYRGLRLERHGVDSQVYITWHGGEATLLPVDYVDDVLDLEHEILGGDALANGTYANAIQTNLYRINRTLELMVEENFLLSVSLDFKPGARVNRAGKDAEAAALANLETLLAGGATCGVALVLGRHNYRHLPEIHDHLERIGALWLRIIPMLDPPQDAPAGDLQLSTRETVEALKALLHHRRQCGSKLPVGQLDRVQETVHRLRQEDPLPAQYSRSRLGDTRLIVHPDGTLASQAGTITPRSLGNIFNQSMTEILEGEAYQATLAEEAEKHQIHCGNCRYGAFCNQRAVFDEPLGKPGPCRFDAPLCDAVMELTSPN